MTEQRTTCSRLLRRKDALWHFIGIGGIGVSAVARLVAARGVPVRGSDVRASQITEALVAEGVDVRIGHDPRHLHGVRLVVHSTAVPDTNPELVAARARGVPIVHRSHVLGALLEDAEIAVGVCGTHGKGTVSAAIRRILAEGGQDPGYAIGGLLLDEGTNARPGGGKCLVAELDESDGSLVHTRPTHAVLNNLELDHPNHYESRAALEDTMLHFARENSRLESLHVNIGDPGAAELVDRLRACGVPVRTFGLDEPRAEVWATDARPVRLGDGRIGGRMVVRVGAAEPLEVTIPIPGIYNLANALAALSVAFELGVDSEQARAALEGYPGLENRFSVVETSERLVVKDYISHPTGIRRVLEGADHFHRRPVVAVFKPYRFTMIHYLADDYRDAFRAADRVIVTELYTAGEVPIEGIDTDFLCRKIREGGVDVEYVHELDEIAPHLRANHADAEMVLFFGGDDLFRVADAYAAGL